jgi:hypothetical protein
MNAIKVTTNQSDVADLWLETDREFASVDDAKAWLNDNYTTGEYVIFDDQKNGGARIYEAE